MPRSLRLLILAGSVILLTFATALVAVGWNLEDCVEVDFDHPDCDQFTTTTAPTTTAPTTTQPEVTTTQPEVTTTQPEVTTTQPQVTTTGPTTQETAPPTTATTVQECVPPLVHNPPFCDEPAAGSEAQVEGTTTLQIQTVETLPFTGSEGPDLGSALKLGGVLALAGGVIVYGTRTRKVEG